MIDWDRVSELKAEVGEEDFAEVLEMFIEEVEEALMGLGKPDAHLIREGLHFVKGSALNIGLSELSEMCREAESSMKNGLSQQVDFEAIHRAFSASITDLKTRTGVT